MEKELIDRLMDEGPILCGLLDKGIVQRLLSRGLVYIDVPINSNDYVYGLKIKNNFLKTLTFQYQHWMVSWWTGYKAIISRHYYTKFLLPSMGKTQSKRFKMF